MSQNAEVLMYCLSTPYQDTAKSLNLDIILTCLQNGTCMIELGEKYNLAYA